MDTLFLLFLIIALILIIIFYFAVVDINNTTHNTIANKNTNTNNHNNTNTNNHNTNANNNDIKGYKNELMYNTENIKDGDYAAQFTPIDFNINLKATSTEPSCSYGDLPIANVNVNYLLTNC